MRGHIGMKIGRIDPWPKLHDPIESFSVLATRGPSLFSNWNAIFALLGIIRGHIVMKLGKTAPWP